MRDLPRIVVYLAVLAVFQLVVWLQHDEPAVAVRRPVPLPPSQPSRPVPEPGALLAAPSPADPPVRVKYEEHPKDTLGTAFPVLRPGLFMTARHVVETCDRVGIVTHRGLIVTASPVIVATRGDVALFEALYQPPPLPVKRPLLRYGQQGFAFGFPKGRWGWVRGSLLGRGRAHRVGHEARPEEVLLWAVVSHGPRKLDALSGMSGGPMLDATGNVVGVNSSASLRRGRLSTVAPVNVDAMLSGDRSANEASRGDRYAIDPLDSKSYRKVGDSLRRRGRVARVLCDVAAFEGIERWWRDSSFRR